MKINAQLSINRSSRDVITLEVNCEDSHTRFLQIEMTPHDFAMIITGLSRYNLEAEVLGLDRVGKVRVRESRSIVMPSSTYNRDEQEAWLKENAQEEGWILDPALRSQGSTSSVKDGTKLNYSVYKFVEKE